LISIVQKSYICRYKNNAMQLSETVKQLIIINILFFVGCYFVPEAKPYLSMYYFESDMFQFWQPITHMFMHGNLYHILFNMFGLFVFGTSLEQFFGTKKFLFFYISCGLGAALLHQGVSYYQIHSLLEQIPSLNSIDAQTILNTNFYDGNGMYRGELLYKNAINVFERIELEDGQFEILFRAAVESQTSVVGASGALYGLLAAFAVVFPNVALMLLFIPIPIKAKYFVPGLMLVDLYLGLNGNSIFGANTGIAHFAHLGGALTGFLMVWYWRKNSFNQNRWN